MNALLKIASLIYLTKAEVYSASASQEGGENLSFDVKVGDKIIFEVESNASTGYTWVVEPFETQVYYSTVGEE